MLSLSQASPAKYEERTLKEFGLRRRVPVRYLPSNGDSIDSELKLYQQILRHRDSQPDILMIDTIWPAILAEDLIDLKPYLPEAVAAAAPIEIRNNTVDGRVVAIPLLFSVGVLYYRPSLLQHYGFHHPPETWDELENMSRVIQQGERRAGNRDFWGYVWTGGSDEGLTCVALEWFLSQGGTNFVEEGGVAHLNNPQNVAALKRAVSWIGTISPPGEPMYHESDTENLWRSGQAAFMRSWLGVFTANEKPVGKDRLAFELAPVPAGKAGHYGVIGDTSLGISKYAANRNAAIEAVREFTSEAAERRRLLTSGIIPTRQALFRQPETFRYTLLRNETAQRVLDSLAMRPSTILGKRYATVSHDISETVNSVLLHRQSAEAALSGLQERLRKSVRDQ